MTDNFVLFDPSHVKNLLPLAFTRPVADFRVGIFTIKEKWTRFLNQEPKVLTRNYLQDLFPFNSNSTSNIFINASVLPSSEIVDEILKLKNNEALKSNNQVIAIKMDDKCASLDYLLQRIENYSTIEYNGECLSIIHNYNVFQQNGNQIEKDLALVKRENDSPSNDQLANALSAKNKQQIYIENGAEIGACILNAEKGSIYIGKNAKILDGAMIQGPVAICDNVVVKMGAKIYGETTIGPHCKVGGEISNSVLFGYSNKGHDGYLGNSVIGEWCNLGADTNNSNLKNNYSNIKCWNYADEGFSDTGLQFCGLIMGDHAKSGINTMFNTGTIVGVAANIFGGGFPPKFIPSFSWGGSNGLSTFKLEKSFEMAENMMVRRKLDFTSAHKQVFKYIFDYSGNWREA